MENGYDTLSQAITALRTEGFTLDFNQTENSLYCAELDFALSPEDFTVVRSFRFEGNSDPGDAALLLAIEGNNGQRGLLVDGYGISSEALTPEMALKLRLP